jgi:chromate transporter
MFALARGHNLFSGRLGLGIVHGLELVAVAVVAQAAFGMMRTLVPDRIRATIVVIAAAIVLLSTHGPSQLIAIATGALIGLFFCRDTNTPAPQPLRVSISRTAAVISLVIFTLLLVIPPVLLLFAPNQPVRLFQAFYRTGALVFGGGHVVLPLLQSATVTPGWVNNDVFLAGYGAAQALPGPSSSSQRTWAPLCNQSRMGLQEQLSLSWPYFSQDCCSSWASCLFGIGCAQAPEHAICSPALTQV